MITMSRIWCTDSDS